jgi:hypothetical protein
LQPGEKVKSVNKIWALGLAGIFLLIGLILAGCSTSGVLIPLMPTRTPLPLFDIEPELVTFRELQQNPEEYSDKVIRVSGDFERLPLPPCTPHSGPGARWALEADNLRLDVVGFNEILQLVEEPAIFTIDGIFRLYRAPLGCGKEPDVEAAWYLEAVNVVEPNPLVVARPFGEVALSGSVINNLSTPTPLGVVTATPGIATPSPSPTDEQTATFIPTATNTQVATSDITLTPTATEDPTMTPTILSSPTATETPGTGTPTPSGQTPTPTTTPSVTPSLAPTDPSVPLPTATSGEGGTSIPPPTFGPYP